MKLFLPKDPFMIGTPTALLLANGARDSRLTGVAGKQISSINAFAASVSGILRLVLLIIGIIIIPTSVAVSPIYKHINVNELRQRQRELGFEESFIRVRDVLKAIESNQFSVTTFESKWNSDFSEPLSSADAFHNTTITYTLLSEGITFVSPDMKYHRMAVKHMDDDKIVSCNENSNVAPEEESYQPGSILLASNDIHRAARESFTPTRQFKDYLSSNAMKKNKGFSILRRVVSTSSDHTKLTPLLQHVILTSAEGIDRCRVYHTETIHPMELIESFDIKSNVSHPFDVMNVPVNPPLSTETGSSGHTSFASNKDILAIPDPNYPLVKCDDTSLWSSWFETPISASGSNYNYKIFSTSACADYSNSVPGSFNMNYDKSKGGAINKNMYITTGVTCVDCYAYLGSEYYIHIEYSLTNGFGFQAQVSGNAGAKVAVNLQNPSVSSTKVYTLIDNPSAAYVTFVVAGYITVGVRFRKLVTSVSGSGRAIGTALISGGSGASASLKTVYARSSLQFAASYNTQSKPWQFTTAGLQMTSFSYAQSLSFHVDLKITLYSAFSATFELKPTTYIEYSYGSYASFKVSVSSNSRRRLGEHGNFGNYMTSPTKSGDTVLIVVDYADFPRNESTIAYVSIVRGDTRFPVVMHHFTTSDTGFGSVQVPWTVPWDSKLCDFDPTGLGKDTELEVEVHCSNSLHNVVRSPDKIPAWLYGESDSIFDSPADQEVVPIDSPYELVWDRSLLKYFQLEDSFSGYGQDIVSNFVSLFVVGENITVNGTLQLAKYNIIGSPINNTGFLSVQFPRNISALGDRFYMQIESVENPELLAWSSGYFQFEIQPHSGATAEQLPRTTSASPVMHLNATTYQLDEHMARNSTAMRATAVEPTLERNASIGVLKSHKQLWSSQHAVGAPAALLVQAKTHIDLQDTCSASNPAFFTYGLQFTVSFTSVTMVVFKYSLSNPPSVGPRNLFGPVYNCAAGPMGQPAAPTRQPVRGPTTRPTNRPFAYPVATRAPTNSRYVCAAGTYNVNGWCYYCPAGYFQPFTGSTGCYACPAGSYNTQYGMETCYLCDTGYSSDEGAVACSACAAGTYAGVYDNYWGGLPTCYNCPIGTYNPYTASTTCYYCADGYSSNSGARSCFPCAAGMYSDYYNSYYQSCYDCDAGTYQPYSAQGFCYDCNPGTYSRAGERTCTKCPQGSFNPYYGSDNCYYCPTGYSAQPGSVSCTICPAGSYYASIENTEYYYNYYAVSFDLSTCYVCNPGYYQPSTGASACFPCAAGTFSDYAATRCSKCPVNTFNMIDGSSECYDCPVGTTSVAGSASCDSIPSIPPSTSPSCRPSMQPTVKATTSVNTAFPSCTPTLVPIFATSKTPSAMPSSIPTFHPSASLTSAPSPVVTRAPTPNPTVTLSQAPSFEPTTHKPTLAPTMRPTQYPITFKPTAIDATIAPTVPPTVLGQPQVSFGLLITASGYITNTQLSRADRAAFAEASCVSMGLINNLGACSVSFDTVFTLMASPTALRHSAGMHVEVLGEYRGVTPVNVAVMAHVIAQQYATTAEFYNATLGLFMENFNNGSFSQNLHAAAVKHEATVALQAFPEGMQASALATHNPTVEDENATSSSDESTTIIIVIVLIVAFVVCGCGVAAYLRYTRRKDLYVLPVAY